MKQKTRWVGGELTEENNKWRMSDRDASSTFFQFLEEIMKDNFNGVTI